MGAIKNKTQFVELFEQGLLGNRWPSYSTIEEALATDWEMWGIRSKTPGWATRYDVPREKLREESPGRNVYYQPMIPKELECGRVFQGEVMRHNSLKLHYSCEPGQVMKSALRGWPEWAEGIEALLLLRKYLWPKSLDMIMELLDWPVEDFSVPIVVEFSSYEKAVGDIPGHNTVIWEVRSY